MTLQSMTTYQDAFPSDPVLSGSERPLASIADLLNLDYFEADPAYMPPQRYNQHHILISLDPKPRRVQNWRDGVCHDFIFRQNEVIVTPAGMKSGWRWHARGKTLLVTLSPEKLEQFAEREMGVPIGEIQLKSIPQTMDRDIAGTGRMMLDALQTTSLGSEVIYDAYARVFLVKLLRTYGIEIKNELAFTRSFTARHYEQVLQYIQCHYNQRIVLDDLAAEAGLSAFHFSRQFKQATGQSPHQFLLVFRIEQAKKILKADKNITLLDVALSCGFSDQAHFTRVFKQHTAKTPACWRRDVASAGRRIR